jgi:hypothetical protein
MTNGFCWQRKGTFAKIKFMLSQLGLSMCL